MLKSIVGSFCCLVFCCSYFGAGAYAQESRQEGAAEEIEKQQEEIKREISELSGKRKQLEAQEAELARTLKEQARRLTQQRDAMEEQAELIRQQKELLDQQRRKIEGLKVQMDDLALPPVDEPAQPDTKQAQPDTKQPKPAASAPAEKQPPEQQQAPGQVGQAPPAQPARPRQTVDVLESKGVLTHRGTLIVEPSLHYSHSSVTRVALEGFTIIPAITIGAIDVREVDRNTAMAALSLRYGVTNHLEIGIKVPYVRRDDTTITRPLAVAAEEDTTTKADGSGLGDVEMNINYMFNQGRGSGPYYVGSLRIKSRSGTDPFETEVDPATGLQTSLPTGTGFWSVQPGVSISYPSDPAVFYGSLSYLHNIGRDINPSTGRIEPGDAVGFSFGMAFALNPRASFSLGYSHNSVAETKQNGVPLQGSDRLQVGSLLMGLSHRVGQRRNLNFSMGAGLTEDAPDVQIAFRMPIAFPLFTD